MDDDPMWASYEEIPLAVRNLLDELYDPEGCEIWWNRPNALMRHYAKVYRHHHSELRPRQDPEAAYDLANALADGVFF